MTALAQSGAAHPPSTTDHGVNETTFQTLWSGDEDENQTVTSSAMLTIADTTDIPLDSPPSAVDQWNAGVHSDWPTTGPTRSTYPTHATLSEGRYLKDAYVEIVAISPSTRTWLEPTDQPLYVASDGRVLGIVDYRVELPGDDTSGSRQVRWRLIDARIVETQLIIDGTNVAVAGGDDSPVLTYAKLDELPGSEHTLKLRSEITVELERTVRTEDDRCQMVDNVTTCRTVWRESVIQPIESLVVEDVVTVTEYSLEVSGVRGRYPNSDLGLVAYTDRPWLGYTLPAGTVRGVWRFYSARDPAWDEVIVADARGATVAHSPLHPLQVHAYPFEPGPTASPRRSVTLVEVYGTLTDPPSLPAQVHLDVMTAPYVASHGLVTRVQTDDHNLTTVTVKGLVRGVEGRAAPTAFVDVPINQSELSLEILRVSDETVRVKVTLVDAGTGTPIETRERNGHVQLAGTVVETNESGMAVLTLPRSEGGITARYVPARWWAHEVGYEPDSAIVEVPGTTSDPLSTMFRIAVPVALLLVATFIVDRFTGWRLWPPWRGM